MFEAFIEVAGKYLGYILVGIVSSFGALIKRANKERRALSYKDFLYDVPMAISAGIVGGGIGEYCGLVGTPLYAVVAVCGVGGTRLFELIWARIEERGK